MSPKVINVVYEFIDGSHFFTSTDPLVVGLCVASTDLRAAYDDIPRQVVALLKLNDNVDASCVHETSFNEFADQLLTALAKELATRHKARDRLSEDDGMSGATPPASAISMRLSHMEPLAA